MHHRRVFGNHGLDDIGADRDLRALALELCLEGLIFVHVVGVEMGVACLLISVPYLRVILTRCRRIRLAREYLVPPVPTIRLKTARITFLP